MFKNCRNSYFQCTLLFTFQCPNKYLLTLIKSIDFYIVNFLKQEWHIQNLVLLCVKPITQTPLLYCTIQFIKFYFIRLYNFPHFETF